MGAQVKVKGKPLTTHIALEGLVTRVDEHVALELGVVQELFVAALHRAEILALSMGQDVLAQRARVCEGFGAIGILAYIHFGVSDVGDVVW